mgnify:CR=1 FL=1
MQKTYELISTIVKRGLLKFVQTELEPSQLRNKSYQLEDERVSIIHGTYRVPIHASWSLFKHIASAYLCGKDEWSFRWSVINSRLIRRVRVNYFCPRYFRRRNREIDSFVEFILQIYLARRLVA